MLIGAGHTSSASRFELRDGPAPTEELIESHLFVGIHGFRCQRSTRWIRACRDQRNSCRVAKALLVSARCVESAS